MFLNKTKMEDNKILLSITKIKGQGIFSGDKTSSKCNEVCFF